MSDQDQLERLLTNRQVCIWIPTLEEQYALGLVRDLALKLSRPLWIWCAALGVSEGLLAENQPIAKTEDAFAALQHLTQNSVATICVTLDLTPHLSTPRVQRALRNMLERMEQMGGKLVMIDSQAELPPAIRTFAQRFELSMPDDAELERIVRETLRAAHRERPIAIDVKRSELQTIIRNLRGLSRRQAATVIYDVVAHDRRLDEQDINAVLAEKRQALESDGLLEYVEAPVSLDEIGGLRRLKQWLAQRENSFSDKAEAFGLTPPRGVLMLGVQGAGKSLCAKAIATAWRRPLLRLDPGVLYDKYVGESERRLRDALRQAEAMAPIILWVDEIEKAFASAAARSVDGGLSQRMFGTLLTWMQEHREPVFLVATANDIEALPPELLRKGRFDEIFFVDLPDAVTREQILAIHLRRRKRDPAKLEITALAAAAAGYSGAEIEQAVVAALHQAFAAGRELESGDIRLALESSPPLSVTMAERVATLREWAAGRCVAAD